MLNFENLQLESSNEPPFENREIPGGGALPLKRCAGRLSQTDPLFWENYIDKASFVRARESLPGREIAHVLNFMVLIRLDSF